MNVRSLSRLRVAAALLAARVAVGAALNDLPGDALAFVCLPDVERAQERFRQTALHRMWLDPAVQPALRRIGDALAARLRALAPARPKGSKLASQDFRGVFAGPASFVLFDVDVSRRPPVLHAALRLGVRDPRRFRALCSKLNDAMAAAGPRLHRESRTIRGAEVTVWSDGSPHAVCWARSGRTAVFALTLQAMARALPDARGRPDPAAADLPAVRALRARFAGREPDLVVYVNAARLRERSAASPNAEPWASLGLQSLQSAALGVEIQPPGVKDALYLRAPAPRRGLLNLLPERSADANLLALAPPDARSARIGRLDPLHAWDACARAAGAALPGWSALGSARLKQVEESLGWSLRRDLLAALDDRFAVVSFDDRESAAAGLDCWALVWMARDAARLRAGLDKAAGLARAAADPAKPGAPGLRWRTVESDGAAIHYLVTSTPLLAPCYAVTDRALVLALHPRAEKLAVARLRRPGPDIRGEDDFQRVAGRVTRPSVLFRYTNLRRSVRSAYAMLPALFAWMAGRGETVPLDLTELPPADAVTRYLFGSASSVTADREGLCWECYSPYGGVTLGCAAGAAAAARLFAAVAGAPGDAH